MRKLKRKEKDRRESETDGKGGEGWWLTGLNARFVNRFSEHKTRFISRFWRPAANPAEEASPTAPDRPAIAPEWLAEFEAAAARPLALRMRYAFIRTYKPVLDDAPFRAFDSMREYREWCERSLPVWLGYRR